MVVKFGLVKRHKIEVFPHQWVEATLLLLRNWGRLAMLK